MQIEWIGDGILAVLNGQGDIFVYNIPTNISLGSRIMTITLKELIVIAKYVIQLFI
jgi:hypothetical protein